MPLPLIAAGLAAAGSALGAYSNYQTNKSNQAINEQNLYHADMMQLRQEQFQKEMFNKANEYNSPLAQYRRYEQAGLNPYMMMSGQSAAEAVAQTGSSGQTPSALPQQAYHPEMGDVVSAVNSYYDAKLKKAQAEGQLYNNQLSLYDTQFRVAEKIGNLAKIAADTSKTESERDAARFQLRYLEDIRDRNIARLDKEIDNLDKVGRQYDDEHSLITLKAQLMRSNIRLSNSQASSFEQGVKESAARIGEIISRIHLNASQEQVNAQTIATSKEQAQLLSAQRFVAWAQEHHIKLGNLSGKVLVDRLKQGQTVVDNNNILKMFQIWNDAIWNQIPDAPIIKYIK